MSYTVSADVIDLNTESQPSRRRDIQGLRAVAVGAVVLGHMGFPGAAGGYVGVDVFFVISGFLITGLLIREAGTERGISLSEFYARRARRILPMATVVLLITLAASYFILGRVRLAEVGKETIWAALSAANWKFAREGTDYFAADLPPSPLQHFWSLGVEEQFCLVWPALLLLILFTGAVRSIGRPGCYRLPPTDGRWVVLLGVLVVLIGASLFYSASYTTSFPGGAYFSTLTRAWELGIGALLALAAVRLRWLPDGVKAASSWLGLAGIVVAVTFYDASTAFPGTAALLPVLASGLVLAGGVEGPRYGAVALLGQRPFTWLGDRSYSLYLWHWPALILAAAYLNSDLTLAQAGLVVAGAVVLSAVSYRAVELPFQRGFSDPGRPAALALWPVSFGVVSLVALMVLAGTRVLPPPADPLDSINAFDVPAAGEPAAATTNPPPPAPSSAVAAPPPAQPQAPAGGFPTYSLATERDPDHPSPDDVVGQAVATAVAAAGAGDPIPDVLTPAVQNVRTGTWKSFTPDSCYAVLDDASSDECTFGPADAQRSMVLFGNSIAGMWLAPLKQIAEDYGWRLHYYVKTACPVADLIAWNDTDNDQNCPAWRDWALGRIGELQPDLAILSTRGDPNFMATNRFGGQTWGAGMEDTIRELQVAAARVVVFSETPEAEV